MFAADAPPDATMIFCCHAPRERPDARHDGARSVTFTRAVDVYALRLRPRIECVKQRGVCLSQLLFSFPITCSVFFAARCRQDRGRRAMLLPVACALLFMRLFARCYQPTHATAILLSCQRFRPRQI